MAFRSAWRSIRRSSAFSLLVVVTLGVGIGATTTMFAVLRAVFIRPLPFAEPDRIVTLWETDVERGVTRRKVTPANFVDWAARASVLEAIGAVPDWSGPVTSFNIATPEGTNRVPGVYASSGFFRVLGTAPVLGRTFDADADRRRGARQVVISHGYWRERFGGDPSAIGRTIDVDTFGGGAFTIVGVMPAGFELPRHARIWLSLADWGAGPLPEADAAGRCCSWFTTVARLAPGVTIERAASELSAIGRDVSARHPSGARVSAVSVVPLRDAIVESHRLTLLGLFGAVACVLLIGCANVANLMLSRGVSRRREVLTRLALGATRWQVARQLLIESGILAALGAIAGLMLAAWATPLIVRVFAERVPLIESTRIDWLVLLFAAGSSAAGALLCAIAPLADWRSVDWCGRGQTESPASRRVRHALVVGEVAAAVTLVATAGLLIRTLDNLAGVNVGFAIDRTLVVSTEMTAAPLRSRGQAAALLETVTPRLAALPGVRAAAASTGTPLEGAAASQPITREGDPVRLSEESPRVVQTAVTPTYFDVMGVPLLKGRNFDGRDTATSTLVAVINETAARRFWPGSDPIGRRFAIGSLERFGFFRPPPSPGAVEWREIVGVVGDVRTSGFAFDVQPEVYYSYRQFPIYDPRILVRTQGDPAPLAAAVRREIRAASPAAAITSVRTLEDVADASVAEPRIRARLVMLFAAAALALGMLGIYGVMAYTVAQQTRELAIRVALGARAPQVARRVVGHALRLTLAGALLGSLSAWVVGQWIGSLLFGVRPFDPTTLAATAALLACAAALAALGPARSALRVDPIGVLRME